MANFEDVYCPECGVNEAVSWRHQNLTTGGVQNGRLKLSEVRTVFIADCEICGDTLRTVDAHDIAQQLTTDIMKS